MRVLRTILLLVGVIFFGALSFLRLLPLYLLRDAPAEFALTLPGALLWGTIFFLASGACAAAVFMSPQEVKAAMKGPPVRRAAWLDESKD